MPDNITPDIIYLDADSEITEAIDKLKTSHSPEVRIAVPARSTMLQSAVNLKLLKKAAQSKSKKLILVSSDKATISLAAGLGMLVAKNVKAEAAIPEALSSARPASTSSEPVIIEQEQPAEQSSKAASKASSSHNSSGSDSFQKKHIALNEDEEQHSDLQNLESPTVATPAKTSKRKGPRIPNYNGLNKKIAIAVLAVLGIILFVLAYSFLPTAKVTLLAKAIKTPANVEFNLDAETKRSDYLKAILAADQVSTTKSLSAQFNATGKKDVGQKATGGVNISNCSNSDDFNIPAGTILTSSGKTFSLNSSVSVPGAKFSNGNCSKAGTASGNITATANGDSYNLSNAGFTISGYDSKVSAIGTTSGGVSRVATVVTQQDIDNAQKTMVDQALAGAKSELASKIPDDERAFEETFNASVSNFSSTAPVDSENNGGTVSAQVKYSELAAKKSDLEKLFETQLKTQIPGGNQLYQTGSNDATYTVIARNPASAQIKGVGNAYYGQTIDTKQVARDVAGKRKKDAYSAVAPKYSQVTAVETETTPALIPNLPFFANRITVEIKVKTD